MHVYSSAFYDEINVSADAKLYIVRSGTFTKIKARSIQLDHTLETCDITIKFTSACMSVFSVIEHVKIL